MGGNPPARRLRRTLGALMGAVAALAVVFAVLRPYATPVTYRAATRVLRQVGPSLGPGFNANHYLADSAVKTPSGYWQVHFVRVAGSGAPEQTVMVPDQVVRKARFLPW